MMDQEIAKYLREGKKRGFSDDILKKKLIDGGFNVKEVSEAMQSMEGTTPATAQPAGAMAMPGKPGEGAPKKSKLWIWILVIILLIVIGLI